MSDFTREDGYVRVEHEGRSRRFRETLFGHTFTDDELESLTNGDYVEFDAVSKAGRQYRAVVKLGEYEFADDEGKNHTGYGPRLDFDEMNRRFPRPVPETWCSHLFTAAEKAALERGETVHLEDCVSKAGKHFSCDVEFVEEEPGRGKVIVPQFGRK